MFTLSAKVRKILGRKVKTLRKQGVIPAVLYGPKTKNLSLEINLKEFEKVYKEAGESSLITLAIAKGEDEAKASSSSDEFGEPKAKTIVLIHDVKKDPLTDQFLHVDFYQPSLKEETEAKVPLVFEGEPPAIKELGGTLVKSISEVEIKALPQNLPHEIKVEISSLKTFEDEILVKDLKVPEGVKILRKPEEIIASVLPPEKVEEELEKPVEEKVEEVEKVGEKEKKEEEEEKEEEKRSEK